MRKLTVSLLGLVVALALVSFGRPAVAAPAFQAMNLTATLSGAEETPDPGDPDGAGTATVSLDMTGGQLTFTLNASNITLPAAAAHIHEGARGTAGGVVVPLTAPGADGAASGSVAVDAALMQRIQQNPAGFYVNVHTSDFPNGALRGQLAAGGAAAPAGNAPATLPATGAGSDLALMLAGLAFLALTMGVGLRLSGQRARRR